MVVGPLVLYMMQTPAYKQKARSKLTADEIGGRQKRPFSLEKTGKAKPGSHSWA
jgi:hypothetical protein